jgi:predicted nucleic acid-binding protein
VVDETFVIDCSIAAKWVLPEPDRAPARLLYERYVSGEIDLIAPDLLLIEFASLAAKLHRRKKLSTEQAHEAFERLGRLAPRLFETRSLLSRAFALSLRHQLSLWDSVYVALATEHSCPLLTADRRMLRSGAARHVSIRALASTT